MNILITGGAGSFGQALVKYLLQNRTVEKYGHKYFYDKIIIYSRDEHKQEQMRQKFSTYVGYDSLRFLIGDIRDKARLQLAIQDATTIVHAAALKVVPTGEADPMEFIKTNVIGTQNLIECCLNTYNKGSHLKVMMLSTDKAVHPINLYGASKLCAEKLLLAANNIHGEYGPRFSVVRYGNVAGSNGSVIPLFGKYVKEGLSLPVTDSAMTRFYLELSEAVEFTLNSIQKMNGGEVFVPNMPSFRVMDLAKAFYNESKQLAKDHDYLIRQVGIRPGEKLHERILSDYEIELPQYRGIPASSDKNNTFLTIEDLRTRLIEMGML